MILMGNSRFPSPNMNVLFIKVILSYQGRIQDLAMGGAKICREASYIYERSELRAKRV